MGHCGLGMPMDGRTADGCTWLLAEPQQPNTKKKKIQSQLVCQEFHTDGTKIPAQIGK